MRLFSTLSLGFSRFFWTSNVLSCPAVYVGRSNMCYYEGIYRNRFGRSFGSHPQANIDEMLVPRGFPREMMRARSATEITHCLYSAPKARCVGFFNHTMPPAAGQQGIKCMLVLSTLLKPPHLRQTPAIPT